MLLKSSQLPWMPRFWYMHSLQTQLLSHFPKLLWSLQCCPIWVSRVLSRRDSLLWVQKRLLSSKQSMQTLLWLDTALSRMLSGWTNLRSLSNVLSHRFESTMPKMLRYNQRMRRVWQKRLCLWVLFSGIVCEQWSLQSLLYKNKGVCGLFADRFRVSNLQSWVVFERRKMRRMLFDREVRRVWGWRNLHCLRERVFCKEGQVWEVQWKFVGMWRVWERKRVQEVQVWVLFEREEEMCRMQRGNTELQWLFKQGYMYWLPR